MSAARTSRRCVRAAAPWTAAGAALPAEAIPPAPHRSAPEGRAKEVFKGVLEGVLEGILEG
eukprot:5893505-Pyramimonas_sp.AAC.1